MKKCITFLLCCVLLLTLCPTISASAKPANIDIPFTLNWDDSDNADNIRPDSVKVELYAYSGQTFDKRIATLLDTKTVTSTEWSTTFSVPEFSLRDKKGNLRSLRVIAADVAQYTETAHTDPTLAEKPLSMDSGWDVTENCKQHFYRLTISEKP